MAHLQGAEMNRMNPAAQADTNNFHNMVPIPYHKRAIRMIKSYLIVGIPILMLTIVALSLLYWIHPIPSPAEQAQNDQMKMLSSSGNKLIDPRYYQDLTDIQIEMIDKLRKATESNLTKPYMKEYSYLVKWLRECDWNLEEATDMLLTHLIWRRDHKIDEILKENFSYWQKDFPFYTDGIDFKGRPVCSADASQWDLKKVVRSNRTQALIRYGYFLLERSVHLVLEAQSKGRNITDLVLIVDLKQFTMAQHGCLTCIQTLVEFFLTAVDNYPGWMYRLIMINTPETFGLIMDLVGPITRGDSKEAIRTFGPNEKEESRNVILNLVPRNQLRRQFGGSKW